MKYSNMFLCHCITELKMYPAWGQCDPILGEPVPSSCGDTALMIFTCWINVGLLDQNNLLR